MMPQEILYLTKEDVVKSGGTSMPDVINDLENLYKIQDLGDYILPTKIVLKWPGEHSEETRGRINAMPAYIGGNIDMAGIKWIGSAPQNPFKYNLPRASAIIILNDPVTMLPVAIMDGTVISAMRTGGVTGVCCKYLAPAESKRVAVIGAGVQSKTQLLAITAALPTVKEIRVYDNHYERSAIFAEDMSTRLGIQVTAEREREKCLDEADIYVTATTAPEPVLFGSDIKKGCYIAHIGGMEVDYDLIYKADKIVIDDWEISKHRLGDTLSVMAAENLIGDDRIYASVGDVVCGHKRGRENCDEIIYTSNVGLGTYDIAVAARIYKYALANGIGSKITLWNDPNWI